jgi:hypothetical protein
METSGGTMQGLSPNSGTWIKDAGWLPACSTPDNDNAEVQSSFWAGDSSKPKRIHQWIQKEECSQRQVLFLTSCF